MIHLCFANFYLNIVELEHMHMKKKGKRRRIIRILNFGNTTSFFISFIILLVCECDKD